MSQSQIFTPAQIESFRKGGSILRDCLQHVSLMVKPGVTQNELDRAAEAFILARGGRPAFKGYRGYPATLCISVNDRVVHGIPNDQQLMEGDIVSLDGGVIYDGLYTDACVSVGVGTIDESAAHFLQTTSSVLEAVVSHVVKAGVHVGDISAFVQENIEAAGYSVCEELTGHGLGTSLHQFPDIPNSGHAHTGPVLPANTVVAIEPIAAMGSGRIAQENDGWTIRTQDGSLACHFEHTVLITEDGFEILA